MSPAGTRTERLEVFRHAWPVWFLILVWSAVIALMAAAMMVAIAGMSDLLGSWAFPLVIALGLYVLAFFGIAYGLQLYERLKLTRTAPSLVADRAGLVTEWSVHVPWKDVTGFAIGRSAPARRSEYGVEWPGVLVSNIGEYRRPWWLSRFLMHWEPANALPVLLLSQPGYLVRRDALDRLQRLGDKELIAELSKLRSRVENVGRLA
jgi:hypothetical protein